MKLAILALLLLTSVADAQVYRMQCSNGQCQMVPVQPVRNFASSFPPAQSYAVQPQQYAQPFMQQPLYYQQPSVSAVPQYFPVLPAPQYVPQVQYAPQYLPQTQYFSQPAGIRIYIRE